MGDTSLLEEGWVTLLSLGERMCKKSSNWNEECLIITLTRRKDE